MILLLKVPNIAIIRKIMLRKTNINIDYTLLFFNTVFLLNYAIKLIGL